VGNLFWWSPDGRRQWNWPASKDGGGGFWSSSRCRLEWGGVDLGVGIGTAWSGVVVLTRPLYRLEPGREGGGGVNGWWVLLHYHECGGF
jgi:hypothetical protein